jgi:hypothetical protein
LSVDKTKSEPDSDFTRGEAVLFRSTASMSWTETSQVLGTQANGLRSWLAISRRDSRYWNSSFCCRTPGLRIRTFADFKRATDDLVMRTLNQIPSARHGVSALDRQGQIVAVSTIRRKKSESRLDRPDFYNYVVEIKTEKTPEGLKYQVLKRHRSRPAAGNHVTGRSAVCVSPTPSAPTAGAESDARSSYFLI